ncbi:MAG: adenylosuccinate synthetase, partial [Candidatus Bathyarchaeia archaeon]
PLEGQLPREEVLKRGWLEYGTVTRRERRAAPFNFDLAKKAVRLNSATEIALTKMDILYPSCRGVKKFDELSREVKDFIEEIESKIRIPVNLIGTGPSTFDIIDRRSQGPTAEAIGL